MNSGKRTKKVDKEYVGTAKLYTEEGKSIIVGMVNVNSSTFKNWQRCWIDDLAKVIELIGEGKMKVLSHILKNTHKVTNEFGGTVREISEETGASTKTVQEVINKLLLSGFMRKKRVATYMVNPEILNYGKDKSVGYLLIQYSELPVPTPVEEAIEKGKQKKAMETELNEGSDKYNRPKITVPD